LFVALCINKGSFKSSSDALKALSFIFVHGNSLSQLEKEGLDVLTFVQLPKLEEGRET